MTSWVNTTPPESKGHMSLFLTLENLSDGQCTALLIYNLNIQIF